MGKTKLSKDFWLLTIVELISFAGNHFRTITVTVLTYSVTESIFLTALQYLFNSVPGFFLSNWAGKLSDQISPRVGLFAINMISGILVLFYLLTESPVLIIALNLAIASLGVFSEPIKGGWFVRIVGGGKITEANGIRTSLGGIIDLVFPFIGGIVIAFFGMKVGILFDSSGFFLSAFGLLLISERRNEQAVRNHLPSNPMDAPATEEPAAERHASAWAFVKKKPNLLLMLIAYCLITAPGQGFSAVFLPFLEQTLGVGAEGFGTMISAFLMGKIFCGFILTRWGPQFKVGKVMQVLLLVPLIWVGYLYSPNLLIIVGLVLLDGILSIGAFVYLQSLFQAEATDHIFGRVFALFLTWHFGSEVIGSVLGGMMAELYGFEITFLTLSVVSFASLFILIMIFKKKQSDAKSLESISK